MGWVARERDFYPVSRPRLEVRAGHLTPCLHSRTVPPCPTLRTAKPPEWHLSPPAPPAPALRVAVHERVAQWGRQPCPYQK
eukprot:3454468-Pleurochrysis_carterae.AAC.1